ncbi:MAG: S9 family peptidase [Bacteroidetes bacterium]|nr:S9 family peptidase [Bacteroidota bacterium]MCW5895819.1 S9 family peptidase [Bacteroidota bacterium]
MYAPRVRFVLLCFFMFSGVYAAGNDMNARQPPMAEIKPHTLEKHGSIRTDNYYWLRERDNPQVLEYLNAENRYTDAVMAPAKQLEQKLFEEMKGRIKQTDLSVPYKLDDYFYYTKYESGKEYPIYCRKQGSLDAREEVMLDGNEMARGHGFFTIGSTAVSSEQDVLAFTLDTVGRRFYTIRFRNLRTGELLPDEIRSSTANIAWANDNKTLFYTKQDPATLRAHRVYRHRLGTDASQDTLVYEEEDSTFSCSVFRTKSKQYIMIASRQTLSTEYRYCDANTPDGQFRIIMSRMDNHEYSVEHFESNFYIRTNYKAKNFRLMRTPVLDTRMLSWRDVIIHRRGTLLEGFAIFKDFLVVIERKNGLRQIRVLPWSGGEHYIQFDETVYAVSVGINPDFETHLLRYNYQSLVTPNSVVEYDMARRTRTVLKQDEVLGGYNPDRYQTERVFAKAPDGLLVPISLVYRKGMRRNADNPLLLYGYGSYGISTEATFASNRLSLLDRGFIYAIAHVRGGQELGREWYEDGKMLKKKNTFTDFIACAEFLIQERYTTPRKLFAQGGSAGGLLMGAVMNMAPNFFKGIVATVPFVDVVTTMLDETIPLTTSEYDEWGNPNEKEYYDYMLSYSPYDNVEPKNYPNLLVMTGLHDSQVQYWEPAKWVAKLRALKTDDNLLLLKTNMEAGHGGSSGRFRRLRETALQYAFMLHILEKTK